MNELDHSCWMLIQLEILPRDFQHSRRRIHRDDLAGASRNCRKRESTLVAEGVEDTRARRDRSNNRAVVALVEEIAGLLPMLEINFEFDSVLDRDSFAYGFTGENRRVIFEAFLLSHRTVASFDDRAWMQHLVQRVHNRISHPIRTRCQNLHDTHVAESIDDHPR